MMAAVELGREPPPPLEGTPLQEDDRDATLAAVFREHYAALVGLSRLLVDERDQAEEVVQEAFARTYEAWPRLRDRDDPLAYVQRSVVNLSRGRLRRRSTVRGAHLVAVDDMPSAEAGALTSARNDEILRSVRGLPRRQRECVVLRFYDDCSVQDIAQALGITEGSVKQHLHRAGSALARVLGDDEDAE
jgi:RNA polymerase sigma-70 factor (sigma-E family)